MLGTNAGLIGAARTSRRGAAVGLWTPNEQVIYQRQNAWIGDANFDSVSLLLHMNGTNGSTTFTDSTSMASSITVTGSAAISTSESLFGGASASFPSTGSAINVSFPSTVATSFGTGDFVIEFALYYTGATSGFGAHIIDLRTAAANGQFVFYISNGRIYWTDDNLTGDNDSGVTVTSGNWAQYAIARSSGTLRIFKDGVLEYSVANTKNAPGQSSLCIGRRFTSSGDLLGYIDELRITKGVARYTSNFTPSSAPFPDL